MQCYGVLSAKTNKIGLNDMSWYVHRYKKINEHITGLKIPVTTTKIIIMC